MVLPLRRFLDLCRHRCFSRVLFPPDPRVMRGLDVLRVHDALMQDASHREIGEAVYGEAKVAREWGRPSDFLRSRVRRLVHGAREMAAGGYRNLLLRR